MHIGLIGGIGPAATVAYYSALVTAFRDADTPLSLTISHADISVLSQNAAQDRRDAQAEVFADHLTRLAAAGCEIGVITALTGHFCLEETRARAPIPVLDGTDVIDRHCQETGVKVLGLLGSPTVLKSRLFGRLTGCRVVVPQTDLDTLGAAYMEVARTGTCLPPQR
ncbi:aspartate/glutamate racemase family protein [Tropicimonas sp. S265A]|uniref:aspartate/glutamate racemase family protein n=1 Tax=Tropicimonas sp. S265A TaxID=3415134 RepID=UPI003C79F84E